MVIPVIPKQNYVILQNNVQIYCSAVDIILCFLHKIISNLEENCVAVPILKKDNTRL